MNCLRYWARYVRKGEVKGGGIKIENECDFFLYVNNIKKYYSVFYCVIFIIIVFAPTLTVIKLIKRFF